MQKTNTSVILFDFFGVLSTPVYKVIIEKYIPADEHATWMKKLDVIDIGDMSEAELVSEIATHAGVTPEQIWADVAVTPRVNTVLFDYIEQELKGKYKIGILTNIPRSLLLRIIPEKMELFDVVLISSELRLIKPSREIFEVAVVRSGCLPQEIVFVDDRLENIEMARVVGLQGIVYTDVESLKADISRFLIF